MPDTPLCLISYQPRHSWLCRSQQVNAGSFSCHVLGMGLWQQLHAKSRLIGKDPDARNDREQEEGVTADEMVGWHHQLHGHEFEQTPGGGEGQGSLACCSPWGRKELDTTERLNN